MCPVLERLYDKKKDLNDKLYRIYLEIGEKHSNLKKFNKNEYIDTQNELNELKQKESELKYHIEKNSREIERNKADRTVANECYFLLKIKLQSIESGEGILKQLIYIHKNSCNIEGIKLDFIGTETDKLLNMTAQFIDRYVEQKLI